jgi:signal transduction histidine kinase
MGLRGRLAALVAIAAVAPLLVYGFVSVSSLQRATEQSVAEGHRVIARQLAERFREYFRNSTRILESIGSQLQGTQLAHWQQLLILQNHVLDFQELREISFFDEAGNQIASTRSQVVQFQVPAEQPPVGSFYVEPPTLDNDLLPTTRIAVRLSGSSGGWVVAEITLEELWRSVDEVRFGEKGFAMLIDQEGRFIAHGDPDRKSLVARGAIATAEQRALGQRGGDVPPAKLPRIHDEQGTKVALGAAIGNPPWTLLIEQPESEALAVANRLTRQLYLAIGIALLATVVAGSWWGRSFIRRIFALTSVTEALAAGRMEARVDVTGRDEIAQLGRQFNTMADRLVELQDEIRKQERQVMFGRIAAGLVHDLSHPIMTIGNSCKLMQRLYDDLEYRQTFAVTVNRELANVKRVLEDLRNVANPVPLTRFPVNVNDAIREAVEAVAGAAEAAEVRLETDLAPHPVFIEGDLFALGRVFRNLAVNAIQATPRGGRISLSTALDSGSVRITVRDTGTGIEADRLPRIFEDFVTTKKHGLGLGLAISRKIVEGLGGRISVSSQLGLGTTFVLEFPHTATPSVAAAG